MRYAVLLFIAITMTLTTGCAKKTVAVHPGAISNFDSYAYDILLVEQDAINQAKAAYTANSLPPEAKDPLNYAITQYNAAQTAWQAYHANGANQSTVQQAIDALIAAVGILHNILNKKPTPVSPTTLFIMEDYYGNYAYAT